MVTTNDSKDRRVHPRYLAYLPIRIRRIDARAVVSPTTYDAFCIDISHDGIRFGTNEIFQLHEALELTLYSPDGGPELLCETRVVRVARNPRHFEIAAKIVRVLTPEEASAATAPAEAAKV
jgi:hypothetical protein